MRIVFAPSRHRCSEHISRGVARALVAEGHEVIPWKQGKGLSGDLLLVIRGRSFPKKEIGLFTGTTAVWLTDEPQESDVSRQFAKWFDLVFTNDRNTLDLHGRDKCFYLPLAADVFVHRPSHLKREPWDVTFVGVLHESRVQLLQEAAKASPEVKWGIWGSPNRHTTRGLFRPRCWGKGFLPHADYIEVCSNSRIVLDIPRDETVDGENSLGIWASSVSPRVFEAAAIGTFVLTSDARRHISELFRNRTGMYRHGDADSLVARIKYWLANEVMRKDVAGWAREHCLAHHTYGHRVRNLIGVVEDVT